MPLGIYLHYPFCAYKCSYCDFYKELFKRRDEERYFAALMRETELVSALIPIEERRISTIFVGGGTPSMISLRHFERWLNLLHHLFSFESDVEFTVESSPDSVTAELLTQFRAFGVTRPTVGIETFDPGILRTLRRGHTVEAVYQSVYLIRTIGFPTFAVDLLFGLPNQKSKDAARDMDELLALEPPHISYYQLTVEQDTPLHRQVERKEVLLPEPEELLAMYRGGCEQMSRQGYSRYEVSSFALPGMECRHNRAYWEGLPYLGLGPSAHSFLANNRFHNIADLDQYVSSLERNELPRIADQSGIEERMSEAIMLGLRTARGLSRSLFVERFGVHVEERLNRDQFQLFVESGHLLPEGGILRLSEDGIAVADEITRRLLK